MRILITTDTHVGFMEGDVVRGRDSLETFEEILRIAKEHDVDFILHGGDLFHDNKPSRKTLTSTIQLLRSYCMGARPCYLEILSDPQANFPTSATRTANYQDPNYNVALPVFAIHGNHDDPSDEGNLCALDILQAANLVNYFGKAHEVDDVTVSPILLRKGATHVALYGLGAVRGERLHRTFLNRRVRMLRPEEQTDDWFSLFVLHQNRARHGHTTIPETFLDRSDLVVWCHEHECRTTPEWVEERGLHHAAGLVDRYSPLRRAVPKPSSVLEIRATRSSGSRPSAAHRPAIHHRDRVDRVGDRVAGHGGGGRARPTRRAR